MPLSDHSLRELMTPAPAFLYLEREDLPGESSVHGFLLDFSDELLLVQTITDFRRDGCCLLRRRDLTDIRCQEYEAHYQQMLEWEGVYPERDLGFSLDLTNWKSALGDLALAGRWVIAEREVPGDDFFLIGPLVRAGDKTASIHHFDALGKWDNTPVLFRHAKLTKVVFDSEYLAVWQRHMPSPPAV